MHELTEAGRCDGRTTNGTKGIWYDTESFTDVDHELVMLLEHAE